LQMLGSVRGKSECGLTTTACRQRAI